ncbi:DUF1853 family protein [Siansivirga zeaxanthinifaciens]|uniref:DUF1853 domain-containing protein n=1 Tax=Siansivirga zeaxanthinifaciens CC-SAMT-1 TaxID=1454006 RepID=A0A0C5WN00_9FLAO|nr:DUF1853 family protein [Siansivirga zeaxanthinifaciens]AJR04225.1 hypothetical protein AW14_11780 [Siansivirga zeaxanthinifaciens CC-SAMT-1]
MHKNEKDTQLQFEGYLKTPLLWKGKSLNGLTPFELPRQASFAFNEPLPNPLRLGKRVERFVSAELKQHERISILAENIQIQNNKITVGELDCVLLQDKTPIHLEIVYKFYLYDANEGQTELDHWIGPNRKDHLVKKLQKLTNHQLPLLHSTHTKPVLEAYQLHPEIIKQYVLFKAQLFLPYNNPNVTMQLLNADCISGFYLHFKDIHVFSDCKWYIPSKINWLITPHSQVSWLSFSESKNVIEGFMTKEIAPLCWIKTPQGVIKKCFIVWW